MHMENTPEFKDNEIRALGSVICKFILPRLICFRKIKKGNPFGLTDKEWDDILGEMIFAFELYILEEYEIGNNRPEEENKKNWERQKKGIELFAKYFGDLWW